jgi:hypothetical protein
MSLAAKCGEHALEVRRERARDHDPGTGDGMSEGEVHGVEHRATRERPAAPGPSVDRVAEDRQTQVGEVDAHLVLSPRLERELEQRGISQALAQAPVRAGSLSGFAR